VTPWAAFIVTVQVVLIPVQAPVQPAKVEPVAGVAVRVTVAPAVKAPLHVLPQVMPLGAEVTVALPVPLWVTVRAYVVRALRANVAVRLFAASMTTAQLPVPVQAPPQPVKVEPVAAVALRARLVPLATLALQVLPQSMTAGLEATVPLPVPALPTVTG
jgi:hypothetical protein